MRQIKTLSAVVAILLAGAAARAQSSVSFANYVALGDSVTAGWESGCLVARHQLQSYPAVLARQMGHVVAGSGDSDLTHFQQPLVSEPGLLQPCYSLVYDAQTGSLGVDFHEGEPGGQPLNALLPRPYNNLAIPGAHSYDLLDNTTSTGADVYSLVLRNFPGSPFHGTNAVMQAIAEEPTFLTVWIGNNDVLDALGSATAISASCGAINHDPDGVCDGITLTPLAVFTAKYAEVLQTLHAALPNTTILVVNVPDVTALPFATTLPPVVIDPASLQPILDPGGHPIPLIGRRHDGSAGPIPADTLVTLGAASLEAQGMGIPCAIFPPGHALPLCDMPLPDGSVTAQGLSSGVLLYADEGALLKQRTHDLNAAIAAAAAGIGAPVVDAFSIYGDIHANGRLYGGLEITSDFLTGGMFSYDGVHPSNVGYAVVADEFVKRINATYDSSLPRPNVYAAMFQPDVPAASSSTGAAARPSRRLGLAPQPLSIYPLAVWQSVLDAFGPVAPGLRVIPVREIARPGNATAVSGRR
jgi:lysophospholipase L1-like esterase